MEQLHKHLMRESALYRAWQRNHPFSQIVHWGIFMIVALSFTYSIGSAVDTGPSLVATPYMAVTRPTQAEVVASPSEVEEIEYIQETVPAAQVIIGDRITVTSNLNVRELPNGAKTGEQTVEAVGEVIGGPVPLSGHLWWNVDFDTGEDGWVAEDYIAK